MNEHLRQTGRTTRMLERAMMEALHGHAVYVLADSPYTRLLARQFEDMWRKHHGSRLHGVKFETPSSVGFDWDQMRQPSAHPNCVFLLDHTIVEREIQQIQKTIERLATKAAQLYPLTV